MTKGAKRRNAYVSMFFSVTVIVTLLIVHPYGIWVGFIAFLAAWNIAAEAHTLADLGFTSRADNEK